MIAPFFFSVFAPCPSPFFSLFYLPPSLSLPPFLPLSLPPSLTRAHIDVQVPWFLVRLFPSLCHHLPLLPLPHPFLPVRPNPSLPPFLPPSLPFSEVHSPILLPFLFPSFPPSLPPSLQLALSTSPWVHGLLDESPESRKLTHLSSLPTSLPPSLPPSSWLSRQALGCMVCLMNPLSQGSVCLASADPSVPPLVGKVGGREGGPCGLLMMCFSDTWPRTALSTSHTLLFPLTSLPPLPPSLDPAYLSHPQDVQALHKGLELAGALLQTEVGREGGGEGGREGGRCWVLHSLSSFRVSLNYRIELFPSLPPSLPSLPQPLAPFLGQEMLPGRLYNHNASLTDAWKYGKVFAGSYYHPACSCRLGKVRPSLPPSLPPSFLPLLISSSRHCLIFPQLPPPSLPPYLNPFSFCFQTMQCLTANSFRPSLPPSFPPSFRWWTRSCVSFESRVCGWRMPPSSPE